MGAKIAKIAGTVWLVIAAAVIAFGYGSILYFEGWTTLQEVASPFNMWNYVAIMITLAPGVALLQWSERLSRHKQETEKEKAQRSA